MSAGGGGGDDDESMFVDIEGDADERPLSATSASAACLVCGVRIGDETQQYCGGNRNGCVANGYPGVREAADAQSILDLPLFGSIGGGGGDDANRQFAFADMLVGGVGMSIVNGDDDTDAARAVCFLCGASISDETQQYCGGNRIGCMATGYPGVFDASDSGNFHALQ